MTTICATKINDLTAADWSAWDEIQTSAALYKSPYFRPEFVRAVAAVRDNVEVGVLREAGSAVGFFPFERVQSCVARPVGAKLSDYQGIIAAPQVSWCLTDVLRGCRLRACQFDHQLASQDQFAPYSAKTSESWCVDISPGYEDYIAGRKAAGAVGLSELLRKFRKLQREHQVRFEWHSGDEAVFDQLLSWKSEQYHRSMLTDLFAYPWITSLLKSIWRTQTPKFAGVLSVMYVDDKVAAVHFGMQSGPLLHSWFPAYDVNLSKCSPGSILLLFMLQCAAEHGVARIDLGKGDEPYKIMFATGGVSLAEGVVETRLVSAAMSRGIRQARDWVRQSPLRERARVPIGWLRQMRDWLALR